MAKGKEASVMRGVYFYGNKWRVHYRGKYVATVSSESKAISLRKELEEEYGRPNPYKIDYAGRTFGNLKVVGDTPLSRPKKRILLVNNLNTNEYFSLPLTTLLGGDNKGIGYRKSGRNPNNNSSGTTGVSLYKRTGKWQAYIQLKGHRKHLGFFDTKEEAIAARKAAEQKYLN
ncbi:hypothetical protein [Pediococcus ethanolidurans]|uniref:hypothetical protein n=1 Tax=Pediococcus ethanolidurans TaxID=319653 RepID=UPI00384B98CA